MAIVNSCNFAIWYDNYDIGQYQANIAILITKLDQDSQAVSQPVVVFVKKFQNSRSFFFHYWYHRKALFLFSLPVKDKGSNCNVVAQGRRRNT